DGPRNGARLDAGPRRRARRHADNRGWDKRGWDIRRWKRGHDRDRSAAVERGARTMNARVLVVDDHPLFREGLCGLIRELPSVDLAGQAATGEEALELVADSQPDVVLMDLHMPGMGGIEATRRMTAAHPEIAVLVLT